MMIRWVVAWRGGIGPNVWDDQAIVEAPSIRAALDEIEPKVKEAGGEVFLIEQEE